MSIQAVKAEEIIEEEALLQRQQQMYRSSRGWCKTPQHERLQN
jgi:hypothetical protein